jgi:tRNA nucleotidyltransferase (CCA-adding enzyme)
MNPIIVPEHVFHACQMLREKGHEAYVVGGCVRDQLLGREPKDWDVTTSATPEQVKECFSTVIDTGIAFGTVTVVYPSKKVIEVTTFRTEGKYEDGRRPDSVQFKGVTLVQDLSRRDFTMNAIAHDPLTGTTYDPFHGVNDISGNLIRAVGNAHERMTEDSLRMLRALRFKAQLGFDIEHNLNEVMKAYGIRAGLCAVERRTQELLKAVSGSFFSELYNSWNDHAELWEAWGFTEDLADAEADPLFFDIQRVDANPKLRLAHLLSDWYPTTVSKYCLGMKLPSEFIKEVPIYVELIQEALKTPWRYAAERRGFLAKALARGANVEDLLGLLEKRGWGPARDFRATMVTNPPLTVAHLAIGGDDLKLMGLQGRQIGETLRKLLQVVIDNPDLNEREMLSSIALKV